MEGALVRVILGCEGPSMALYPENESPPITPLEKIVATIVATVTAVLVFD
jgi:hypothetical protein